MRAIAEAGRRPAVRIARWLRTSFPAMRYSFAHPVRGTGPDFRSGTLVHVRGASRFGAEGGKP